MKEISTRIWLDEKLWDEVTNHAIAEGVTVRELIPRLLRSTLAAPPASAAPAETPAPGLPFPSTGPLEEVGPPVLVLSDVYRCSVCGAQVKVGGLTIHMGKHMKERHAPEAERS